MEGEELGTTGRRGRVGELGLLPGATARAGVQGNLATLSPRSGLPGAGRETPRIRYTPLYLLFEGFVRFSVLMTMIGVPAVQVLGHKVYTKERLKFRNCMSLFIWLLTDMYTVPDGIQVQ